MQPCAPLLISYDGMVVDVICLISIIADRTKKNH